MKIFANTKFWAICLFFLIAVAIRALAFQIEYTTDVVDFTYMAIGWAEGVGPCIGAIVAVWACGSSSCNGQSATMLKRYGTIIMS